MIKTCVYVSLRLTFFTSSSFFYVYIIILTNNNIMYKCSSSSSSSFLLIFCLVVASPPRRGAALKYVASLSLSFSLRYSLCSVARQESSPRIAKFPPSNRVKVCNRLIVEKELRTIGVYIYTFSKCLVYRPNIRNESRF